MLVGVPVPFGKGYIAHTFRLWHAFGSPTPVSFETARLWTIPTRAEAFPGAILVKTRHELSPMLSRVRTFAASK